MADKTIKEGSNPLWYKDAIIYQVHVRSFYDSTGDGMGDFKGLIHKLDYIQSLGVNTLWLLPFYPSPLKDGGYDIADFKDIHPSYGTLADFKKFVKEAHSRGLRIITELVINHTSSDHKWFQRARKSKPDSAYRDFYVWNDNAEKYKDARIIFQDFEVSNWTYDHEAKAYYWHRFYSHQPDLNFENPMVQNEIIKILDFWFEIGVDGFRLDAVPYLYEEEGTNCENLPKTHEYLKKLRKYVDNNYQDKLLLAEANQWPIDSRAYFGDGDECHMAFHFPLMPRMYMALRMEDRFPVVDIMEQTPPIPDNCQWAIFLRNHDELTLEMVSDEERDYMYKTFAKDPRKRVNVGIRRRLFPLLGGDTRTIELLNFLLFSMPGTPIIYYGDEIGMGDNYYLGDRDGVRTPMQWSPDRNAGFSVADPQKLFLPVIIDHNYHYTTVNVENRERNPSSFLWWKRRVIAKRKRYKAFGRGSLRFINSNNPKVLSFVREYEDETILVIVNLSRYSQHVEIDLHEFAGSLPIEVFSRNEFPVITQHPWMFSMQFKNYFWFELQKPEKTVDLQPQLASALEITQVQWKAMNGALQNSLKQYLKNFLLINKWFRGNEKKLIDLEIVDTIPVSINKSHSWLFIVRMDLVEAEKEMYTIPVSVATNNTMIDLINRVPETIIASVKFDQEEAVLYDGMQDEHLVMELFDMIRRKSKLKGRHGELEGSSGSRLKKITGEDASFQPHVVAYKISHTSLIIGDKYYFKIYRNPQEGENTDVEIIKNLTRHSQFNNLTPYVGRLDYRRNDFEDTSIGLLVDFIPNVESAWEMTQTAIEAFFDKALSEHLTAGKAVSVSQEEMDEWIGHFYLEMMALMGQRTAEMHQALTAVTEVKGFEPEPFSLLYQKSLYQAMRTFVKRNFTWIEKNMTDYDQEMVTRLKNIINKEDKYLSYIQDLLERGKIKAWKTRIHGNYKLNKLLFTGKDFVVTDFEGEVESLLSVRKLKHNPLKDVASMLGSLQYAMHKAYMHRREFAPENENSLLPLMDRWNKSVGEAFINGYYQSAHNLGFIPQSFEETSELLNLFIFERSLQELRSFMISKPSALAVPVKALQRFSSDIS
jgi:maltose alpha-D-glucosyltransferase / alpha-amylase